MLKTYHTEICQRALGAIFSPKALTEIITSNLAQDGLLGQIGHPEFHFDDNAFHASYAYMDRQYQIVLDTIKSGKGSLSTISKIDMTPAWKAFGRLTHAGQDFYAHSNYISLWVDSHNPTELPPPGDVEAFQSEILNHPDLCSGNVYFWDWLAFIPGLHGLAYHILPPDSHTHMNLDSPKQGPLFSYAIEAAIRHTSIAFEQISEEIDATELAHFTDR